MLCCSGQLLLKPVIHHHNQSFCTTIECWSLTGGLARVNRWEWLWSWENIKGVDKDVTTYVGWSMTLNNLFLCACTVCMNYVFSKMFLLVSFSVSSKQQLCFVYDRGQLNKQTHTTKNFVGFHLWPFPFINCDPQKAVMHVCFDNLKSISSLADGFLPFVKIKEYFLMI